MIRKMEVHFDMGPALKKLSSEETAFRVECMNEEVQEFTDAETREDQLDALIDLVVFAKGTASRLGFGRAWDEAFERVMSANMAKVRGGQTKRGGFHMDLIKPEGWQAPGFADLLTQGERE